MNPKGNAANIERLCNWFKLHFIRRSDNGKIIKTIDQKDLRNFDGSSSIALFF